MDPKDKAACLAELRARKNVYGMQVAGTTRSVISTAVAILVCILWCLFLSKIDYLWIMEPWIILLYGMIILGYVFSATIGTLFGVNCIYRIRQEILKIRWLHWIIWGLAFGLRVHLTNDAVLQTDEELIMEFIHLHPNSREVLPPSSLYYFGVDIKDPAKLDANVNAAMQNFAPTPCKWGDAVEWIKQGNAAEYAHCVQWLHLLEPWEKDSGKVILVGETQIPTKTPVWCSPLAEQYSKALDWYDDIQRNRTARDYRIKAMYRKRGKPLPDTCKKGAQGDTLTGHKNVETLIVGAQKFGVLPVSGKSCKAYRDEKEAPWYFHARDSVLLLKHWAMPHVLSWRALLTLAALVLPQVHPGRQLLTQAILCVLAIAWRDCSSGNIAVVFLFLFILALVFYAIWYIELREPDVPSRVIDHAGWIMNKYRLNDINHALNVIKANFPECKWM